MIYVISRSIKLPLLREWFSDFFLDIRRRCKIPFKSKSQQRYFFAAESEGKLPKGTARRWAHETKDIKSLPEKKEDEKERAKKALYNLVYGRFRLQ